MFEIGVTPEVNREKAVNKIPDSVLIIGQIKRSGNKAMRQGLEELEKGNCVLDITKKFIDARHGKVVINYRFDFISPEERDTADKEASANAMPYLSDFDGSREYKRPVVVGTGPAGLYSALILAKYGLRPIVLERGPEMEQRIADTEDFKQGKAPIKPNSNIQFGEGGAGTFSDGKLYSGISSGLKDYVLRSMIAHGAPSDILYDAHPHIGTDRLRKVVTGVRNEIISLGGEVRFNTTFLGYKAENGTLKTKTASAPDSSDRTVIALTAFVLTAFVLIAVIFVSQIVKNRFNLPEIGAYPRRIERICNAFGQYRLGSGHKNRFDCGINIGICVKFHAFARVITCARVTTCA